MGMENPRRSSSGNPEIQRDGRERFSLRSFLGQFCGRVQSNIAAESPATLSEATDPYSGGEDWLCPYKTISPKYQGSGGRWEGYEQEIFKHVDNTFRGIRHSSIQTLGLKPSDFEGKVVLDLGSGNGGLAKSASIEEINTTVISVNPSLQFPERKASEENNTAFDAREDYPHVTDDQLVKAQQAHDAHLVTAFAHDLHEIPDNSVDIVVDNVAVHAFMHEDRALYEQTVSEMLRVTRDRIIVGDGGRSSLWITGIPRAVLEERGIRYDLIYAEQEDGSKEIRGATIYK
jgi:hypothetical protein